MTFTIKQKVGALVFDVPRYAQAVMNWNSRRHGWVMVRNRNEGLSGDPNDIGVRCNWKYCSDLYLPKVFPSLGKGLMRRALKDWPIRFASDPRKTKSSVTFIIGHRGANRVPHLLATLKSVAAQVDVGIECLVVEQSEEPEVKNLIPSWVRYVHTPLRSPDQPYNRAWAFNVGAELARTELLIFHDNDMLVPQHYAAEITRHRTNGYEVINVKRFIFYLHKNHSKKILSSGSLDLSIAPEVVVQNSEAGGSFAIERPAFFSIGGFDENFVGWGGEDNEFWERAETRAVWPYGYMPIVHLWHEPQPEKALAEQAPAKERYWKLSEIPAVARIEMLLAASTNPSPASERDNGNF